MDLKKQAFQTLDAAAPKHAILASNAPNMSFTEVALAMRRPKQVGSMHFFSLPVFMNLVEVIRGKDKRGDNTANI
jgi:3-hydroxyacyl-CoA dehydrogenase